MTKPNNYDRMIKLAEDVFATKEDPDQLDVNYKVLERLKTLHPATVGVHDEGEGPVAWLLVIPTTLDLMHKFIEHQINEKELFNLTQPGIPYEALYLCSALVLEEYRRKGIIKDLVLEAIENIKEDHSLKALYVWAFTEEGDLAADHVAQLVSLPLYKKTDPAK